MDTSHLNATPAAFTAFREKFATLRQNARQLTDVHTWLETNLFFKARTNQPPTLVKIDGYWYSAWENPKDPKDLNPALTLHVTFAHDTNYRLNVGDLAVLRLVRDNRDSTSTIHQYGMRLQLADWPVLTTVLLRRVLAVGPDAVLDQQAQYRQRVVEHYLPQHFPGFTLSMLMGMEGTGLLPTRPDGMTDYDGLIHSLFDHRGAHTAQRVELPDSLVL